uniref:NADPH:adrenodoxin oxidoreductase, mitochondrial n=1 Tax=Nicotiana sylvestris TaxID=4096 RepID=A0A1U7WPJ3_NICSY|nr:PREDICTED: NADPH:adrenodoxin oxidoreductase, mitochondrial isoform X3 [Nicotiana sylvestris]
MAVSRALRRFWRTYSTVSSERLRFCIVGSGPAGFYTADKILKAHERAEVDIVDRLPTPFGLVSLPEYLQQIVTNQFSRVVQNGRCSFIGNVSIGISISLAELRELYDVVVLSYGAESDQALGIPGEELAGIYAAREFVWWYNGHPDCRNLAPDLKSSDTAVIIGQGNVALDVARILLRPTSELATTDIASHALAALEESSIRKVYLVGRRGAAQAAFTAKELREVLGIKDLFIEIQQADLSKTPADEEELKSNRIKRRIHELLSKAATSAASVCSPGKKELHFVFFRKPDRFLESDCRSGHVAGLRLERTILKEDAGSGRQIAVGTGLFDEMECGLVLKSVGYKSRPVDGLPFDLHKGIVPNVQGRVLSEASGDALVEKGLYVCGWLKRGPTGIIATNLYCAEETVASISEDIQRGLVTSSSGLSKPGRDGLLQLLDSRNVKIVPFGGWEKIDSEEKRRGSLKNKPREKLTSWQELLEVAAK